MDTKEPTPGRTDVDRSENDRAVLAAQQRAQDCFEQALLAVGEDFEGPTQCPEWTVRDVVGHVVWGRWLVDACLAGQELTERRGAPGAAHPGVLIGHDPVAAWRRARRATDARLDPESIDVPAPAAVRARRPGARLADFLDNLTADFICHAWDLASVRGLGISIDSATLRRAMAVVERGVARAPGMFAEPVAPPSGAAEVERFVAFLGRDPDPGRARG